MNNQARKSLNYKTFHFLCTEQVLGHEQLYDIVGKALWGFHEPCDDYVYRQDRYSIFIDRDTEIAARNYLYSFTTEENDYSYYADREDVIAAALLTGRTATIRDSYTDKYVTITIQDILSAINEAYAKGDMVLDKFFDQEFDMDYFDYNNFDTRRYYAAESILQNAFDHRSSKLIKC